MATQLKILIGVVVVTFFVLPPVAFVVPVLRMNAAVERAKGKDYAAAVREVGQPVREWRAGEFQPARGWPTDRTWTRGRVVLVMKWDRGWYIFFDESDIAVDAQHTKS